MTASFRGRESIGIWLTNACNLHCTYCYVQKKNNDTITTGTALNILSKELMEEGELLWIDFMGAEPLTRFERIREIVEGVSRKKWKRPYKFMAATNGTLLDETMKAWFRNNRETVSLGLSYDGKGAQSVNRTPNGAPIDLDFFFKTWPLQPWKVTISEKMAANVVQDLIDLHEKGISFTANAAYEDRYWSEKSIAAYEWSLFRLAEYYAANPQIKRCNLLSTSPSDMTGDTEKPQQCYCSAGESFRFYDMEGNVYPCHLFSEMTCEKGKTVRGAYWPQNTDFEDPDCADCPVKHSCYTCPGSNWNYRGDIRLRDPLHCRLYQAQVRAAIHLLTESCYGHPQLSEQELRDIRAAAALERGFREGKIGMKGRINA